MATIASPLNQQAYNRSQTTHHCPDCKSPLQRRVSRGWIVKSLFFWLPIKRYRCDKCFRLVYVRGR